MVLRRLLRRKFSVTLVVVVAFLFVICIWLPTFYAPKRQPRYMTTKNRNDMHDVIETVKMIKEKNNRFVVYNRVPKCGSMSITVLCYQLGAVNGFQVASPYEEGEKPSKTEEESKEFITFLHQQPPGFVYIRHQYFIDFEKYNQPQPIYINMIRDPVARFQSFYYFSRFGNQRGGGGAKTRMSDERRKETIDECIQKRRQECHKPYWQVVPYFCGQEPGCMSRSQWAVEKAKENIRKHYAFVGILEELDTSLQILEVLLPRYFKDARSVFQKPENHRIKFETQTREKKELSEAAKDFLKTETSLKLEYELYHFVQRHITKLKQELL